MIARIAVAIVALTAGIASVPAFAQTGQKTFALRRRRPRR